MIYSLEGLLRISLGVSRVYRIRHESIRGLAQSKRGKAEMV